MVQRARLATGLSGAAGEYFVAAELSRRGYIASLTPRNAHGIDILASSANGRRSVGIQVKTNQGAKATWVLNVKAESIEAENLFYVFVRLHGLHGRPEYHIVGSSDIAAHCREDHKAWLGTPGRKGRKHRDTSMRRFSDFAGDHLDKWERLGLGPQMPIGDLTAAPEPGRRHHPPNDS